MQAFLDDNKHKTKKKNAEKYESKLDGWSPSPHVPGTVGVEQSMEGLNLGPSAADAAGDNADAQAAAANKKLSKEERKRLAAEAFAKKNGGAPPKREKMSKQERRALQEAQRSSKENEAAHKAVKKPETLASGGVRLQYDDAKKMAKRSKESVVVRTRAQKQVALFSHLPQYERESSLSLNIGFSNKEIHPSVLSLGLKYAEGKVSGGNARCIAMLTAFKDVIADYVTPPNKLLRRDLDKSLRPLIQYLIDCRPHCISMGNAIRSVRNIIATVSPDLNDEEAKKYIIAEIDEYIQSRILLPMKAIAKNALSKITDGDVILTYARTNIIENVLMAAHERKVSFRVVVVDSRPHYEGKKMVQRLAEAGLQCTYVQINALSYVMRDVSKVLLGASAFMGNGVAVGRVGTALVAMAAHDANVPVLFCCETYKFSDRVQLDAITHNQLLDPQDLLALPALSKAWRSDMIGVLNVAYDVTPSECVSIVVTEVGLIPPTAVRAIVREYAIRA
ncbi:TPA: hypothetical protein N0F65_009532 [Lagenidium giganteum]|uniref:Translation initiation factor eIF2B subunit delta n=1 Tax=Lagenidium giganteum TaxID=4803 RepID=A0AAV2YU22_9STRA|nr:TPA: hypothetical protein N0F65_009532 [Lagenidium giganteum]